MTEKPRTDDVQESALALGAVLAIAAALRLAGFISPIFTDETLIFENIARFASQRTILPSDYLYPPLFSYLAAIPTGFAALAGAALTGEHPVQFALLDSAFGLRLILPGPRLLSLMFSLVTVLALWRAMPRGSSNALRAAAAIPFALSATAVRYGAYALPDLGMTMAAMLSLVACLRHLETGRPRDLYIAAIWAGICGGFKFNGALVTPAIAAAALLGPLGWRAGLRHTALAAAICIGAFLLTMPTWLLAPSQAWAGFEFQTRNMTTERIEPQTLPLLGTALKLLREEPALFLGMVLGGLLAAVTRSPRAIVALAACVPSFLVIGFWKRQDANYFLQALPAASLLIALALAGLSPPRWHRPWARVHAVAFATLLFLIGPPPLRIDNADRMSDWLAENLPYDSTLVRDGLWTPKVWDHAKRAEFLEGRGRRLTAESRRNFFARLDRQPQAARILVTADYLRDDPPADLDATIQPGTFFLTSGITLDAWLRTPTPRTPALRAEHAARQRFYLHLLRQERGWRLVREESAGSGTAQFLFYKTGRPRPAGPIG